MGGWGEDMHLIILQHFMQVDDSCMVFQRLHGCHLSLEAIHVLATHQLRFRDPFAGPGLAAGFFGASDDHSHHPVAQFLAKLVSDTHIFVGVREDVSSVAAELGADVRSGAGETAHLR